MKIIYEREVSNEVFEQKRFDAKEVFVELDAAIGRDSWVPLSKLIEDFVLLKKRVDRLERPLVFNGGDANSGGGGSL